MYPRNSLLDSTHREAPAYDYNFMPVQSSTLSRRENEIISAVIREANKKNTLAITHLFNLSTSNSESKEVQVGKPNGMNAPARVENARNEVCLSSQLK